MSQGIEDSRQRGRRARLPDDINPHERFDTHKRRAQRGKDNLERKGRGPGHAEYGANVLVMDGMGPSTGGNNSGANPSRHVRSDGQRRAALPLGHWFDAPVSPG